MIIGTHGDGPGTMRRVFPSGQPWTASAIPAAIADKIRQSWMPEFAAGRDVFLSFKPPTPAPTGGGGKMWKPFADAIAEQINSALTANPDRKLYCTVWHEWENDMTFDQYFAIYTWWYGYLKSAIRNDRFQMGTVNMAYQWAPGRTITDPVRSVMPLNSVDFYGLDAYSHTPLASGGGLDQHPGWSRWLSALPPNQQSKVFLVERGFDVTDEQQVDLLIYDWRLLHSMNAVGMLYWNTNASGHQYTLGVGALATLGELALDAETPPPPTTFTQADIDAADLAGYNRGLSTAYADMAGRLVLAMAGARSSILDATDALDKARDEAAGAMAPLSALADYLESRGA